MNIWSYLFSTINFNFLFNALNVSALTVTSSLILGEKPQTVAGLMIKISNSFLCDNKILQ